MFPEIYSWIPVLVLVLGVVIGVGIWLYPKGKDTKELEYNLRKELEDWHKTQPHIKH